MTYTKSDATAFDVIAYLEDLPLVQALFWYIENVEDSWRSDVFFYLRSRFRSEVQ